MLVLLVATTLSVYNPWGLTAYGRRRLNEQQKKTSNRKTSIKKIPVVVYSAGTYSAGYPDVYHFTSCKRWFRSSLANRDIGHNHSHHHLDPKCRKDFKSRLSCV